MPTPNLLALSTITPKQLVDLEETSTGWQTIYTVPSNHATKIGSGVICNTTDAAVAVSLAIVISGGTAGTANEIISSYPLAANDSLPLNDYLDNVYLGDGDFLALNVDTANAVNVVITGVEMS